MRILIEPAALMHVIGTTMDFVSDRIKCAPVRLAAARLRHAPENNASTDTDSSASGICV